MMKGRKPIPTQTHIIHGTFGSRQKERAAGEVKPELVIEVPAPPASLGKHGREIWISLAAELVEKRLLTVLDITTLEVLCSTYQVYAECRDAIYKPGGKRRTLAAYMRTRTQQTSLELSTMRSAWAMYKSYMAEFGLSASSRVRLPSAPRKSPEQEDIDRMKEILARP